VVSVRVDIPQGVTIPERTDDMNILELMISIMNTLEPMTIIMNTLEPLTTMVRQEAAGMIIKDCQEITLLRTGHPGDMTPMRRIDMVTCESHLTGVT